MVCVVLEACVDDPIVGGDETVLVSGVKINAIRVKEESKLQEKQVHIDGHQHRDDQQRRRTEKLIDGFVRNDGEGGGVEEHMVVSVMIPKLEVNVSESVVEKLKKV